MEQSKACAITGHRPSRFKWRNNENNTGCKRLKKRLNEQFVLLYEQGVKEFWIGGSLGVDLWAGEELLRLKTQPEYSDLQIHLALPLEGHDINWDESQRARMNALRDSCTSVTVIGESGQPAVLYKKRNYYMVDHSDFLVAVYDKDRSIRSGTGMTVNYAKKKHLRIIYIHPDSGKISSEPI